MYLVLGTIPLMRNSPIVTVTHRSFHFLSIYTMNIYIIRNMKQLKILPFKEENVVNPYLRAIMRSKGYFKIF